MQWEQSHVLVANSSRAEQSFQPVSSHADLESDFPPQSGSFAIQ